LEKVYKFHLSFMYSVIMDLYESKFNLLNNFWCRLLKLKLIYIISVVSEMKLSDGQTCPLHYLFIMNFMQRMHKDPQV